MKDLKPAAISSLSQPHSYTKERTEHYRKKAASNPKAPHNFSASSIKAQFQRGGPNAEIKGLVLSSTDLPSNKKMAEIVGASVYDWSNVLSKGFLPPAEWLLKLRDYMSSSRKPAANYFRLLQAFYVNGKAIKPIRNSFKLNGQPESLVQVATVADMSADAFFEFLRAPATVSAETRATVLAKLHRRYSFDLKKIEALLERRVKSTSAHLNK